MDGVIVLNTFTISDYSPLVMIIGIICGIISAIFFYLMVVSYGDVDTICCRIISVVALIGAIFILFMSQNHWRVNVRQRYECVLDKNVSFMELCEKYNVIEQRGDIWVLEEKIDGEVN